MPWIIKGLDRETGERKTLRFEVTSEDEAVCKAGDAGCVVESVKHVLPEEPMPTSKPQKPQKNEWVPPKVGEAPRIVTGEGVGAAFFVIVGFFLMVGGIMTFIGGGDPRFKSDNAIGAATNALENIQALAAIAAGTLCFIAVSLIQLRGVIRFAVARAVKQMKGGGE